MIQKKLYCFGHNRDKEEVDAQIKKMVSRVNLMRDLLFEIKAGTPLGKTVKMLLNLFLCEGEDGIFDLTGISCHKLANLIGISHSELQESLEYLQQQGIILYKPILR
ncbi:hypothetical protein [Desulfotruncus alcoholivorax]|uniref:hypothetical protein n=1 Tax=Desulfotruncus alcoholivorax TaxID=265477 RepID=UPI0003F7AC43|nr:hypothetical protein [Desulfotruncus alcoholivorax]